jgi:hypothetical protein
MKKPADVYARLRRLKTLSAGFRAELDAVAQPAWPFYPVEAILYREAISQAQQAVERAYDALRAAADRMEEVKWRGR